SGYSWPHIIFGAIIITIIILMIIIGNFLVIWAILHDRTLKTTQNLFIMSLAFADFFLGLIVIPFSLTYELLGYWLFGVIWCELYKAIDVLLCTASIMSLCLISLDRYWSITRAVHYARQRTRKRAAIMIFTVWFISAVVSIPPLIGWKQPARESRWALCNLSEDIGYVVYSAFGSFFIPAFIMVFVYFKIYQAAKERARKNVSKVQATKSSDKHEQKHSTESSITEHAGNRDLHDEHNNGSLRRFKIVELRANGSSTVSSDNKNDVPKHTVLESLRRRLLVRTRNSRKRKPAPPRQDGAKTVDFQSAERQKRKLAKARERRATVVLGLVMAAFILCWLPFFGLYLASAFCPGCIPEMVFTVFFWIGYCNSALNPIIYTVFNRDFKRAFQKILFGRKRGRR
ncbi:unnamed protein product, partial [Lymnaea stagnalis]